ncbi:MAG: outer membrane beta-barrel protein, partial [Cyclobacteriaceae bacterium]
LPANNLLVRRNYTTEYGVRHAWRLKMGVSLSLRDSLATSDFVNELNTTYLMIRMGHEWQFPVEDKTLLYFGGDVQFGYTEIDEKGYTPGIRSIYDIQDRIYEPGISVMLGARYFIKPWMSVNLESEIGFRYRIRRYDEVNSPLAFPVSGGFSFVDSETFLLNLSPIHSMNLSFHF